MSACEHVVECEAHGIPRYQTVAMVLLLTWQWCNTASSTTCGKYYVYVYVCVYVYVW